MSGIRVALAGDNVLLRAVSRLVAANEDFELVGVASDLSQLLALGVAVLSQYSASGTRSRSSSMARPDRNTS